MRGLQEELRGSQVLVSCEGGAEDAIIRLLLDEGKLCFDSSRLIDITRLRKASDIERQYLGFEYDEPVVLLYVTDSLRSQFKLGALYRGVCSVRRICTRPEIEILVIINEGAYDEFKKSNMKPSAFCKQKLGMRAVKRPEEVRRYWTPTSLQWAAEQYARLHRFEKGEFSLADILG